MKGADVKCPKCGKGLADVAPDYDFDPGPYAQSADTFAHCFGGHPIFVTCDGRGMAITAWEPGMSKKSQGLES